MPLQGNLRDFSTTQVLNLISLSQRTGTLTIYESTMTGGKPAVGELKATLSFRNGKLVYAIMKDRREGLAAILHEAGKLTGEQARLLHERAKHASDKALALLLINGNYLSKQEVVASIKRHNLGILYSLMLCDDGLFRFDENLLPGGEYILAPIDLTNVIVEGPRHAQEEKALLDYLPTLNVTLKFPANVRERYRDAQLSVDEWRIVANISPSNTISHIARAINMTDMQIRRIIYGLEHAGLIGMPIKFVRET